MSANQEITSNEYPIISNLFATTTEKIITSIQSVGSCLDATGKSLKEDNREIISKLNQFNGQNGKSALEFAKNITMSILVNGKTLGHGLLVSVDSNLYLLSAARVVLSCYLWNSGEIQIKSSSSKKIVNVKMDSIFINKEYILAGTNDIGLLKISISEDDANILSFVDICTTLQKFTIGKELYGLSDSVYIKGFVHYSTQKGRMLVNTYTVPTCSGIPLFDSTGKLACIVHGNSILGRYSSSLDELNNIVYSDSICNEQTYYYVDSKYSDLIKLIEKIPEDIYSKKTNIAHETAFNSIFKILNVEISENTTITLHELMIIAKDHIWNTGHESNEKIVRIPANTITCSKF